MTTFTNTTYYRNVSSPIGSLLLVTSEEHLIGLYMNTKSAPIGTASLSTSGHPPLDEAEKQVREFFAGERRSFDLPLNAAGTNFQKQCWQLLSQIPYGETWSYGEMARRAGNRDASRAVGAANGRNPISIVVPCHRVIGASGKLVGFGGGLPRKAALLAFERAMVFGESASEFWACQASAAEPNGC